MNKKKENKGGADVRQYQLKQEMPEPRQVVSDIGRDKFLAVFERVGWRSPAMDGMDLTVCRTRP